MTTSQPDPGPQHHASEGHGDHDHDHDHGDHDHGDHDHEHPGGLAGWITSIFRPHSHDAADSIDSALESSTEGIRAVKISLVGLGATAIAQAVIVVLTGSVALLAVMPSHVGRVCVTTRSDR